MTHKRAKLHNSPARERLFVPKHILFYDIYKTSMNRMHNLIFEEAK
jgi:hypothetical protein